MVKPASLLPRPRRPPPLAPTSSPDCRFKGVRMRSWGRWVSEIRIPHSREKIWLGSYGTAQQAARAYDVASLLLRGPSCAAFLNFSDSTVLMMDRLAPLANGVASPRTIQVTAAAVANADTGASGAATEIQPYNIMPAHDEEAKQSLNTEIITEESSQWRKDEEGESGDTLESISCWIQDVMSLLSPKDKTSPSSTSIPCFSNSPSNGLQSARATSLEQFNAMFDEFHPFESLAREGFTVMSPAVTTRERFDTDTGCSKVDSSLWS